jgi:type IV pilus assembly protein PilM
MKFGFKKLLEINNGQLLGLDIGSSAVKIVQLQKGAEGFSVAAAGIVGIDKKVSDEFASDLNIIRAVRSCVKDSNAQAQMAICGVCGSEVAVRTFKFPVLPREEVAGAVALEAAQVCPFNVNDSMVDYQLIENGQDTLKGILVAATDKLVKKKKWFAEEASLTTVLMDVDGLALLNLLRQFGKVQSGRTAAVLNVGFTYTTLAIIGENNLPFIRDITYGGNDIIAKIAERTNKQPDYVKAVLEDSENQRQACEEFDESLTHSSQRLVDEVSETIRYYAANEKFVIKDIYLCGGFALVKKLEQLLNSQINAGVVVWNPFENIKSQTPLLEGFLHKKGPALAVAAGLALRST